MWVIGPENTTKNQFSEPHVQQGPPPTTQTSTLWAHTTSVWVNGHQNTTRNPLSEPMFTKPRPLKHKQQLRGHSQRLCTLLESNFQDPMFLRVSPYKTTHITSLWAHTTAVWVNEPQNTTGTHLSQPHIHQGPPPTTQPTTL